MSGTQHQPEDKSEGIAPIASPDEHESSTTNGDDEQQDPPRWLTWVLLLIGLSVTLAIGVARELDVASSALFTVLLVASGVLTMVLGVVKVLAGQRPPHVAAAIGATICLSAVLVAALVIVAPSPPGPAPMTGEFNVAVAQFDAPDGDEVAEESASALSDSVHRFIADEAEDLRELAGVDVQIRSPAETGALGGGDRTARAEQARLLADEINADLVIYGTLEADERWTSFSPEFVFSSRRLQQAEELLGQHELGNPLVRRGPPPDAEPAIRDALAARAIAFAHFVIGLTQYRVGEFERATEFFGQSLEVAAGPDDQPAWPDNEGKEVLHLFLGNAAGRSGDLDAAADSYQLALQLTSGEYARAHVGLGEVARLRAGCTTRGTGDKAQLEQALMSYEASINADIQPALSGIRGKAALGSGNVLWCLDDLDGAQSRFETAIEHGASWSGGAEVVAEAHMGLGLIAVETAEAGSENVNYATAIDHYEQSVELHPDLDRVALSHGWLGWLNDQVGDREASAHHCAQAEQLDLSEEIVSQFCGAG